MSTTHNGPSTPVSADNAAETGAERIDMERREALGQIGRFAAYMAPVMIVLLSADEAAACHDKGNLKDPIDCSPV